MTCLTLLIDIISTWVYIGKVGLNDDDPSAQTVHLGQLFAVFFYFILDIYFALWLVHFRFRLPDHMQVYLPPALLGFGDKLDQAFGKKTDVHILKRAHRMQTTCTYTNCTERSFML